MHGEIKNLVSFIVRNWFLKAKDEINRKVNPYSGAVSQFITDRYQQLNQNINLEWRTIPIEDNGEQLVEISDLDKRILYNKKCYKLIYPYSIDKCFVRETVAIKLKKIIDKLPSSYHLLIFDAWRPIKLQEYLFQRYRKKHPNLNEKEVSKFISNPYYANKFPPPHYTGGAIDVALLKNGILLEMKNSADKDFSEISETNYYNKLERNLTKEETDYKNNRDFLCEIMNAVGFSNYEKEYWHFDYGNQFWAKSHNKEKAYYGGIEPSTICTQKGLLT